MVIPRHSVIYIYYNNNMVYIYVYRYSRAYHYAVKGKNDAKPQTGL